MLILYTTEDGRSEIQLRAKGETVWLSQREMADLFDVSQDNVGLHLKNIYADQELEREEGAREVRRTITQLIKKTRLWSRNSSAARVHKPKLKT